MLGSLSKKLILSSSKLNRPEYYLYATALLVAIVFWASLEEFNPLLVLLGLVGAIFANSTGAGGGVVFIPTFHQLGLSDAAAVVTSFGIQTFGMTAGAIAWITKFYWRKTHPYAELKFIGFVTLLVIGPSIAGLYTVEYFHLKAPATLAPFFAWFSIVLGICILSTLFYFKPKHLFELSLLDQVALVVVGYFGGMVTAWLSVGVGELIAFYLIARGANPASAIASAVVITALSVWSMAPLTFAADSEAVFSIVWVAGPAAVIGGLTARYLVDRLSTFWLKMFFGSWLILIGLFT